MTHATKSGRGHLRVRRREGCLDDVRYLLSFLPVQQPGGAAARRQPATTRCGPTPELTALMPASPNQPYDMKKVDRRGRRRRRLLRVPRPLGHEPGLRVRPHRRPRRRHRRQPATGPRRRARHRQLGKGRPLRPHLRQLQHPARHLRRRPRVHARHRPGVRRHHPPRGQAALRLLRGDRAPHPGHHPQGLRGRLRGHELQVHRRRPGLRLAVGRAGGHGPPGRGRDRLPAGAGQAARPGGPAAELVEEYTERYANPYLAAERGYVDDVIDPAETRAVLSRSLDLLRSKREELPKRKHGNVPL